MIKASQVSVLLVGLVAMVVASVVWSPWTFYGDRDMAAAIEDLNGQWVDRPAPDFQLQDRQGRVYETSDFEGQVVFLNFWATFCEPCRREMPSMERLVRRYQDQGMVMVAISQDEGWQEIDEFMNAFLPGQRSAMTVLLDEQEQTAHRFGTELLPETYIIDRDGQIVGRFLGDYDWNKPEVNQIIEGLL